MTQNLAKIVFIGLVTFGFTGCDSDQPQNMMEGVDLSELEEYERLIEADNAAMSTEDDTAIE